MKITDHKCRLVEIEDPSLIPEQEIKYMSKHLHGPVRVALGDPVDSTSKSLVGPDGTVYRVSIDPAGGFKLIYVRRMIR